jgi:aspartate/methionine/tyrosine aminotransferase
VFTLSELEGIAAIMRKHPQILVVSDEVYKYTIHTPTEPGDRYSYGHTHFARLPDMFSRTVTISSCGKTFSATGWQVGWVIGPQKYIQPIHTILPAVQFCVASPVQEAVSHALSVADQPYNDGSIVGNTGENYYDFLRKQFINKKKILETSLSNVNIHATPAQGGFFLLAKLPEVKLDSRFIEGDEPYDWSYLRMLAMTKGVVGIPASPFFSEEAYGSAKGSARRYPYMARFAFCKKDSTLLEVQSRLSK